MHTVATGGCYLTPDISIKLASGRQDPLTKRERQVAEKLAQGMAVKEIAAELGLSPKTVHVHRANLMENWASVTTLNWRAACLMAGDEDVVLPLNYRYCLLFYLLCAWFCLWSISLHLVERLIWRCCYFRLACG